MTRILTAHQPPDESDFFLLSLDGGGVRGLSSLMILRQLMKTVDSENPPEPGSILT